jgi:pimeloyl-ACP methyl ester carboxylesterase
VDTPVVLIHGATAGPWIMSNFSGYFEQKGFYCHTPAYRYHDGPPSDDNTSALLAGTSIADYIEDIAGFVESLDTARILVGHSLGGVVAQKLAARGLPRAIILLNGSVNRGVLPATDQERALGKRFMSAGPFWEGTCPILMVSGSDDLAIPPSIARLIAERHGLRTTFHQAQGFKHFPTLEAEWKKIAQICSEWMVEQEATV